MKKKRKQSKVASKVAAKKTNKNRKRLSVAKRKKIAKQSSVKSALKTPKAPSKKVDIREIFSSTPVIEKEGGQIRVLIGKAGLDGHDRGAKVIARACRDAGFEVIYTGLHQSPEMIVNTAIQEDVDVVGLSILSGAHNYLVPEVVKGLKAQGVDVGTDMHVLVGGIIPESDFSFLRDSGVSMVFTPGTSVDSIVDYIRNHVRAKQ